MSTQRESSEFAGRSYLACPTCEGEGYTFAVYGQLDTYEECPHCEGTGDRFGRGSARPIPTERGDG